MPLDNFPSEKCIFEEEECLENMKDAATPLSFNACVFDTDRSLWKSSVICHKKSLMNHSLSYMTGRNCQMSSGERLH